MNGRVEAEGKSFLEQDRETGDSGQKNNKTGYSNLTMERD